MLPPPSLFTSALLLQSVPVAPVQQQQAAVFNVVEPTLPVPTAEPAFVPSDPAPVAVEQDTQQFFAQVWITLNL